MGQEELTFLMQITSRRKMITGVVDFGISQEKWSNFSKVHLLKGRDSQIWKVRPKKVVLFPEIDRTKKSLLPTRPHKSNVYVNIYFLFQKTHKTKIFPLANLFVRQVFIQAVVLMSVFERRLSFWMLYFVENDHKIILQKGKVVWRHCKLFGGPMAEL